MCSKGEEHGKVTLRCHPQLDVRHILKRSLYLRYASQDTHHPHHRQRQAMHSEQITHYQHQRRGYKKELIREMELHAKQHREPYSHTCQRTAEQKQYIFPHPRMFAYHIVHGTHVYTATELKAEGLQQVYPRSHALWHPFVEHRHGKRWRSFMTCMFIVTHIYIYMVLIYTPLHTPHSFLHEVFPYSCSCPDVCALVCAALSSRSYPWHCPVESWNRQPPSHRLYAPPLL